MGRMGTCENAIPVEPPNPQILHQLKKHRSLVDRLPTHEFGKYCSLEKQKQNFQVQNLSSKKYCMQWECSQSKRIGPAFARCIPESMADIVR